jgi:hypothetical protein
MKDHDTDNDFLDDLYSHSAKEIPPAVLDQAILKQAHDHVHKDNFFQRLQLQRVFSVAAVLVLSVYIVFDVGEKNMGVEDFSLTEESTSPIKEQRLRIEKSKVKRIMDSSAYESTAAPEDLRNSSLRKEQFSEINSFQGEEMELEEKVEIEAKHASRDLSVQALSIQVNDDEGVIVSAEKMIEEIEKRIAEDKLVDAKKTYKELSDNYPEYPVPIRIVQALK